MTPSSPLSELGVVLEVRVYRCGQNEMNRRHESRIVAALCDGKDKMQDERRQRKILAADAMEKAETASAAKASKRASERISLISLPWSDGGRPKSSRVNFVPRIFFTVTTITTTIKFGRYV
eukprot:1442874-Rhodomonas_salina.5